MSREREGRLILASREQALQTCVRCGLPETYETIEFDGSGLCNICSGRDFKQEIDWAQRHRTLMAISDKHRGRQDYDCIVPFSGGKDSTFTLFYVVKELRLRPLVVQFNHGFMRDGVKQNNEKTLRKLGVDSMSFTPNWHVVKMLMRESLLRKGDFCWHCHTGIFAFPMHIALRFQIPLVIWGEPSSEYTAYYDYRDDQIEQVNEERFNRFINLGLTADDMAAILQDNDGFDERDLRPYSYPARAELEGLGYESITLGSFIPWDTRAQSALIKEELGWTGNQVEGMPDRYDFEKIECWMQGSRDYLKYLKRGYGRVTQMTALDRRNGSMTEDEAEALVADFEGSRPPSLDLLLEYTGLTEEEFNAVAEKTSISPHRPFFEEIPVGSPTKDFHSWFRENQ